MPQIGTMTAGRALAIEDVLDHEHGGPYGPGAEPVQRFLARLSGIGRASGYWVSQAAR